MKKTIFFVLCVCLFSCNKETSEINDIPELSGGEYTINYRVVNRIEDEIITIIAHENTNIKILDILNPGETSKHLSLLSSGNNHIFPFRTSIKEYNAFNDFETIEFYSTKRSGIIIKLLKNTTGKYYAEVIEE